MVDKAAAVGSVDWRKIGELILSSPFNRRDVADGVLALKRLLKRTRSPADLVLGSALGRTCAVIQALSGERIVARAGYGDVGGIPLPRPETALRLIKENLTDRRFAKASLLDKYVSCALTTLLAHPLKDGNGRLFRLIIAAGLLANGLNEHSVERIFALLYRGSGGDFLYAVQIASGGDESRFWQLWADSSSEMAFTAR